ncbi:histidine phosphatase family protein [Microbacterium sp. CIAB417]|uniref:histidine phosphatase family protein n=1 Tax=Microbacterium sp. CIAB417 TaxID=2860287 RepID=UPI001FAD7F80|nr:histidine phosphatase family protein [Microbacterium sp. CIAB417]
MSARLHSPRSVTVATTLVLAASLAACSSSAPSEPEEQAGADTVTIYLTRHGETMLNELDRVQGWSDSPLVGAGEEVAADLGEGLAEAGVEFTAAYSADMVRHFSTATIALETAGSDLDPIRDERLREVSFGRFEGAANEEMWSFAASELGYSDAGSMLGDGAFLEALDAIAAGSDGSDLTAETAAEVGERAVAALEDIAESTAEDGGGNVLVVSSGITIMVALGTLGADLSGVTAGIENAAVSELVYEDGEWTVETVNDLSYVEAGAGD